MRDPDSSALFHPDQNLFLFVFSAFFADSEPRSIDFSPFRRAYRGGSSDHGSPSARSVQSEVSPLRSFRLQQTGNGSNPAGRIFATPPAPRRGCLPSPKNNRPSWVQRHLQRRRPKTVNVDDATLSGKGFILSYIGTHYLMGIGPNPKKSPRIAESRFGYLKVCSSIV